MKSIFCTTFVLVGTLFGFPGFSQTPKKTVKADTPRTTSGTEFNFEETTVKGDRSSPMGSILEQASPDQSYDFVTIRGNWRKEMIQSADTLDAKDTTLNIEND